MEKKTKTFLATVVVVGFIVLGFNMLGFSITPKDSSNVVLKEGGKYHVEISDIYDGWIPSLDYYGYYWIPADKYSRDDVEPVVDKLDSYRSDFGLNVNDFFGNPPFYMQDLKDMSVKDDYINYEFDSKTIELTTPRLTAGKVRVFYLVVYQLDQHDVTLEANARMFRLYVYNPSCPLSQVNILDYIDNDVKQVYIDNYYGKHGLCLQKEGGGVGSICGTTGDCRVVDNMQGNFVLPDEGESVTLIGTHCEKDMYSVSGLDSSFANFISDNVVNAPFGFCMEGVTNRDDCYALFGDPSQYYIIAEDGERYSEFSDWQVYDGKCYVSLCGSDMDCFSLYNSAWYGCRNMEGTEVGTCIKTSMTSTNIQERCEEIEGGEPSDGYGWDIVDGKCVEKKLGDQCDTASDCSECDVGEVRKCVKTFVGGEEFGACDCVSGETPTPTTTTVTTLPTTTIKTNPLPTPIPIKIPPNIYKYFGIALMLAGMFMILLGVLRK